MKREERTTLNALRRNVTPDTIRVEVPAHFTIEGRQAIHELLVIEKSMVAVGMFWNPVTDEVCMNYAPSTNCGDRQAQEAARIEDLERVTEYHPDRAWTGARKPAPETEPDEETEPTVEDALETLDRAQAALDARKDRSAWDKGVTVYASELLDGLRESIEGGYFSPDDLAAPKLLRKALLNGASDWSEYSWGGSALIYDGDIARRLCCPSELRKTREGERRPNAREEWLDCQARALFQAANRVERTIREAL